MVRYPENNLIRLSKVIEVVSMKLSQKMVTVSRRELLRWGKGKRDDLKIGLYIIVGRDIFAYRQPEPILLDCKSIVSGCLC